LRSDSVAVDPDSDGWIAPVAATKKPSLLDNVDEGLVGIGLAKSARRPIGAQVKGHSFRIAGAGDYPRVSSKCTRGDKNCSNCAFHGFIIRSDLTPGAGKMGDVERPLRRMSKSADCEAVAVFVGARLSVTQSPEHVFAWCNSAPRAGRFSIQQ
jgi:hypothetical protein